MSDISIGNQLQWTIPQWHCEFIQSQGSFLGSDFEREKSSADWISLLPGFFSLFSPIYVHTDPGDSESQQPQVPTGTHSITKRNEGLPEHPVCARITASKVSAVVLIVPDFQFILLANLFNDINCTHFLTNEPFHQTATSQTSLVCHSHLKKQKSFNWRALEIISRCEWKTVNNWGYSSDLKISDNCSG